MLFNSIDFVFFFALVVWAYFALPHRFRSILLLVASYYFYMCWKVEYAALILVSTAIGYFSGLGMGGDPRRRSGRRYMFLSVCGNLGILFAFKYFNFVNDSLREIFNHFNIFYGVPAFNVLLPVGISFYTFQILSYTLDVYKGKKEPERDFLTFALYVSFFPQLVAGPIERSTRLLPQFHKTHGFDYERISDGVKLMAWGMFKKIVIADRLAVYVNHVYNNVHNFTGIPLLIASYFFAFQIYCDFSGYSDIAIGSAQVLGYRLMDNFNRPYFSKSISEFWRRWHISLSTWFKDYLYIPLGGNRVSQLRWAHNIAVVFLLTGVWHGAKWTFVLWGLLHGFYIIFGRITESLRVKIADIIGLTYFPKLHAYLKVLLTFHLVVLSWVLFRANSLSDSMYVFKTIFTNHSPDLGLTRRFNIVDLWASITVIGFLLFVHYIQRHGSIRHMLSTKPIWFRWSIYYIIIIGILVIGKYDIQDFIYFQF